MTETRGQTLRSKLERMWGEDWRKHAPRALRTTLSTLDRQIGNYSNRQDGPLYVLVDLLLREHEYRDRQRQAGLRAVEHRAPKRDPMGLEGLSDDARYLASLFAGLMPGRSLTVTDVEAFTERARHAVDELVAEGIIEADNLESGGIAYRAIKSTRRARTWVKTVGYPAFDVFGHGEQSGWTSTQSSV